MRIRALTFLLVALTLVGSTTALAGDDDTEALEKHIALLIHESRALKAEGRLDAAEILWKRAHELKARLAERAQGKERVPLTMDQAERVLHGLEMGMESLKALKREKELKALAKVANEIRARMQKARKARAEHPEIQEAKRQLEILRVAFHGLREAERREAMERMEHAIHVMELNIDGRRDEEAQDIRRRGPDRAERVELLRLAAKAWDHFGHEGKAKTIRELAEKMGAPLRRKQEHQGGEREILQHRIEVMGLALEAMREAEKERLVGMLERAIRAHEMRLHRPDDEETRAQWKQAPTQEQLAELLGYAAHLYAEWGHEERAALCKQVSLELLGKGEKPRKQAKAAKTAKSDRKSKNRRIHEQRLELWEQALVAFREADKHELVERAELVVKSYVLAFEGREDDEAREIWRRAPKPLEQAELAAAASHLYARWGKPDPAHALMALSHELSVSFPGERRKVEEQDEHLEILQHEIHELRQQIERLERHLEALRHRVEDR